MRIASPERRPLFTGAVADKDTDRHLREQRAAIEELRSMPALNSATLQDVELADGVETPIVHGLGRVPQMVVHSTPRGALASGYIEEIRTNPVYPRSVYIVLRASGYGGTVAVDVEAK